jgi:hypothetical protein
MRLPIKQREPSEHGAEQQYPRTVKAYQSSGQLMIYHEPCFYYEGYKPSAMQITRLHYHQSQELALLSP